MWIPFHPCDTMLLDPTPRQLVQDAPLGYNHQMHGPLHFRDLGFEFASNRLGPTLRKYKPYFLDASSNARGVSPKVHHIVQVEYEAHPFRL